MLLKRHSDPYEFRIRILKQKKMSSSRAQKILRPSHRQGGGPGRLLLLLAELPCITSRVKGFSFLFFLTPRVFSPKGSQTGF